MRIYILRHGDSPSAADAGVATDAERPLSARGRETARKAAEYMRKRGAAPALILVSPLRRAQETAQEAARVLKNADIRTYEPLANRMSGADLLECLNEDGYRQGEFLAIGHLPQVAELAQSLTGQLLRFDPAGQAAVDTESVPPLLWAANPEELVL